MSPLFFIHLILPYVTYHVAKIWYITLNLLRLNFILIKVSSFFLLFQISCFPFLYHTIFFLLFVLISWEYGVICVSSNTGKQQKKVNCVNVDFKDDFITFLLLYFVRCLFAYLLLLLLL